MTVEVNCLSARTVTMPLFAKFMLPFNLEALTMKLVRINCLYYLCIDSSAPVCNSCTHYSQVLKDIVLLDICILLGGLHGSVNTQ